MTCGANLPHSQTTLDRQARHITAEATSFGKRWIAGAFAGLLALASFLWLTKLGVLHGWWMLAVFALAVLAVPSSKYLSWRIMLSGSIFFGAVPMLWWIRAPEGVPDWGHLLLSVLLAGLMAHVVGARDRRRALAALVPKATKADYLILVAAVLASVALAPYFLVFSGPEALEVLLTSWDNSSHFNMYYMLRSHGTVIPMAGMSDTGHPWSFLEYPQGFHAAIAAMSDMAVGGARGALGQELVAYSRLSALTAVASTVMVTAGITSMPWIRKRPLVGAPFVVLAITAWSFGTAAHATFYAFQNFLLGVALLVCLMIIAAFSNKLAQPVIFGAAACATLGIANTWVLLLLLAAPAVMLALFPWVRVRWQSGRAVWMVNLAIAVVVLLCLTLVARQISRIGTGDVVTAAGSVQSSTHGVEIATLLVAIASSMLLAHGSFRQLLTGTGERHLAARLIVVPLTGLALVVGFGSYQILVSGRVTYYSLKLALAVELLLPVVACITITALVDRWLTTHKYVHPRGLPAISVLTALAASQVYGLTVPDTTALGTQPLAPYQHGMSKIAARTTAAAAAAELFRAADAPPARGDSIFITNSDRIDPLLAATWYLALTGTENEQTNKMVGALRPLYSGYSGNLVRTAENILGADPKMSLVMDRSLRDFLQSGGLSRSMVARVMSPS